MSTSICVGSLLEPMTAHAVSTALYAFVLLSLLGVSRPLEKSQSSRALIRSAAEDAWAAKRGRTPGEFQRRIIEI